MTTGRSGEVQYFISATLWATNILQGNKTSKRCRGIYHERFIANFTKSVSVKEFIKSLNIWRIYGQKLADAFLWLRMYARPNAARCQVLSDVMLYSLT